MKPNGPLCEKQPAGLLRISGLLVAIALTILLGACNTPEDGARDAGPNPNTAGPVSASPEAQTLTRAPVTVIVALIATQTPLADPTSTPVPTPAPSPSPTPAPEALLDQARRAVFNGDDTQATALYQQYLAEVPDPTGELAARAKLELARILQGNGDTASAIQALEQLVEQREHPSVADDARIVLAREYAAAGDSANAIRHYTESLSRTTVISPYLNVWLGDAFMSQQQPANAVAPYLRAVGGAATLAQQADRREKLALAYQLSGKFQEALDQYDAILASARIPSYRGRILWESAQVLMLMDQKDAAYQRMRSVIQDTPNLPAAFSALNMLLERGQPVDELQRGIVDYNNGAHEAAREAFKRAIRSGDRLNEIRYWAALNYLKLRSPADTFRNLDEIIASGPSSPRYADAVLKKGETLEDLGNYEDAAAAYQSLASSAPADPQSAAALLRAGRVYNRDNRLDKAAAAYLDAQRLYPAAEIAPEALLRGGVALYRLGRTEEAISAAQTLVEQYPDSRFAALGQLWLGKAQLAAGQIVSGQATLDALAQARPDEYEGARAAEILSGAAAPLSSAPVGAANQAPPDAQTQAEDWLRNRLGITETADLRSPRQDLRDDPRFQRGTELQRLGFEREAFEEFASLRADYASDPLASYQLALHLRDKGMYRASIGAADALARLLQTRSITEAPAFIGQLLYPRYYSELVDKNAADFGLDPLLVNSVIRQESLFEPSAASSASAYGLMQVIPPTGREINRDLNWPDNYADSDLTRPYVSVRYGTYYLDKQRRFLDGDLYAALAAYNGGPGNSRAWKDRSGGDPDVFYMTVNFDETQRYLRAVAANYAIYHRLYGR